MYWHVLISAIVWFPLGVMVICYSAIFWKLDRYEQKVLRRENPRSVSYKTKVAKMMFTVLIVFVLFRVPFTALIFIRNQMLKANNVNQAQGAFSHLWYCSHYLMFCNAAINPLIYGLTNDNFKKAYRQSPLLKLFCRGRTKSGVPSEPLTNHEQRQRATNMGGQESESGDLSKRTNHEGFASEEQTQQTNSSNVLNSRRNNDGNIQVISSNLSASSTALKGDQVVDVPIPASKTPIGNVAEGDNFM